MVKRYNRITCFFLFFLLAVLCLSSAQAEMYICRDASGSLQYTNVPASPNCEVYTSKRKTTPHKRQRTSLSSTNPSKYDSYIRKAGRRYKIDPNLIKAVIKVESDFDRYAVSKAGAQGLMQLMPETAKELNVRNPFDAHENIHGGTLYLRNLLNMFDGDLKLTLAAYNAGPTLVKRINRVPRIPETTRYVTKVLRQYKRYKG